MRIRERMVGAEYQARGRTIGCFCRVFEGSRVAGWGAISMH